MPSKPFTSTSDILRSFRADDKDKYISQEFQKYGYELAKELDALDQVSLFIKLAKVTPRGFMETAKNFVKDAQNVKNRTALFMWKLDQLKKKKKQAVGNK